MRALRHFATATMILTPVAGAHAAERNWIDHYIAAHGHCSQAPGVYSISPLDKPIREWTDGDLADLKAALDRCEEQARSRTAAQAWTIPVYRSIAELVREEQRSAAIEEEAKLSARDQAAQLEATRQRRIAGDKQAATARLTALQRAADQQVEERKAAEARTAAVADELKAASHLAEETEARTKAVTAEAQARYGVEAARKRAADAEQQASNADAQARADRQAADQRFAAAHPEATAPSSRGQARRPMTPPADNGSGPAQGPAQVEARREPSPTVSGVTNENFFACKMLNEMVTASQAIVRGDGDIGASLVNAGECFLVDKGTSVEVKRADVEADDPKVVCLGIAGHPGCLWMPTNILEGLD